MLGLTRAPIPHDEVALGLAVLIGGLIFLVWQLSRRSQAERFGAFVLFFVLAFGMLGFIAKSLLQLILGA